MNLRGVGSNTIPHSSIPRLIIPKQLFQTPNAAMDHIFDLFPDKYPHLAEESDSVWSFELGWPRHLIEPIDPFVQSQALNLYALPASDIDRYVEVQFLNGVPFVFSMFHSMALLAASISIRMNHAAPNVIIHLDAHHDLGPTMFTESNSGVFSNPLFCADYSLNSPNSIRRAIVDGSVNKGNFLTTYLLNCSGALLVHIHQDCSPGQFGLVPSRVSANAPSIVPELLTLQFDARTNNPAVRIVETQELPVVVVTESPTRIWLDVDLDAFCNRFDGNSDRFGRPGTTLEYDRMMSRIETFITELGKSRWHSDIVAISVAASPGFFPSEYWPIVIPRITNNIKRLLQV